MAAYTLPDLPYDTAALEPHLSGEILELHHGKHHKAYVDGANTTQEKLAAARDSGDGWQRVVVAFQPNRFNRIAEMWRDYADAFDGATRPV